MKLLLCRCPLGLVLLSSFLGGVVNVFAYGIVGKLSPVTYQIVGNAKTILVIVLGILFFPVAEATANQVSYSKRHAIIT